MKTREINFRVCMDEGRVPPMFGITCKSGERALHLSTDFMEVDRLVRACNRHKLSVEHFWDVIEDFRHS